MMDSVVVDNWENLKVCMTVYRLALRLVDKMAYLKVNLSVALRALVRRVVRSVAARGTKWADLLAFGWVAPLVVERDS